MNSPGLSSRAGVSSFYDRETAERAAAENHDVNRDPIERWLRNPAVPQQKFDADHARPTGRLAPAGATEASHIRDVWGSRIILRLDAQMSEGFHIHVAFPVDASTPTPTTTTSADHDHGLPALANFLGAYLNQDYVDDPDDTVRAFRADAPEEYVHRVATQVRELRARGHDDDQLWAVVFDMGCGYYPWGDGRPVLHWLAALESDLRA